MFSFSHLLIGLAMIAGGFAMVKYTFKLLNITGPQQWMERYTGSGSTYGMYKLAGVAIIIMGILFATGFGNNLMDFIFSPLKGIFKPLGQ